MSERPVPVHVIAAARIVSDWMAQYSHPGWIVRGCADSSALIALEKENQQLRDALSGVFGGEAEVKGDGR